MEDKTVSEPENMQPERITAGPCSKCGAMFVGMNACPYCGNEWIGTRITYTRAPLTTGADDEKVAREIADECDVGFLHRHYGDPLYVSRPLLIQKIASALRQAREPSSVAQVVKDAMVAKVRTYEVHPRDQGLVDAIADDLETVPLPTGPQEKQEDGK